MHVHRRFAPGSWRALTPLLLAATLASATVPVDAQISPALTALRPIKGISYQPSPSDDCQLQTQYNNVQPCQGLNGYNSTYYDTDFYNTDFALLWGPVLGFVWLVKAQELNRRLGMRMVDEGGKG